MSPSRRRFLLALAAAPTACRRPTVAAPAPPSPPPAPEPTAILPDGRWNPARTWVFAVGILRWRSPSYPPFDAAGRQDAALVEALRARGVPAGQIVYVTDAAATRAALDAALAATVARTRPGDLVWFYYAGHGATDEAGALHLVPYDTGDELAATAWPLAAALATIDARHRGPVLLTGDCCHSGAMAVAASAPRANPYAALASSLSSELSTGTWTFTECLLAGLAGEVVGDGGPLTLRRLADFTIARMANQEEQLATFAATPGLPPTLVLGATAAAPSDPRVGSYVDARSGGAWYRARVLDASADGRVRVTYGGYAHDQDEWLPGEDVRPYVPAAMAVGAAVEAEWHGRWYAATVRASERGIQHVHYDGFGDAWDEWVSSRRVRPTGSRRGRRGHGPGGEAVAHQGLELRQPEAVE
jgi:hypothetical protein